MVVHGQDLTKGFMSIYSHYSKTDGYDLINVFLKCSIPNVTKMEFYSSDGVD